MTDDNHGMYGLDLGKIDCLDTLLDAWEKTFDSDLYFNRDGIISNEHWMDANVKILFVLKETNKAKQNLTTAIQIALRSEKSGWWKGKVLRRVGRWAYGLAKYTGEVPSFENAKACGKEATWGVAYINMRKTAGGARTEAKSFDIHVKKYAPYIRRQIELIKPDIVVLGGTFRYLKRHVFPEMRHICTRIHKQGDMIFINAFHPAAVVDACHIYNQVLSSYHNYKINYACEEIAPTEPARA